MQDLICYKQMPIWHSATLPPEFKEKHNTQAGTWAKLVIIAGWVDFEILTEQGDVTNRYHFSTDNQPPFIEPEQWYRIVSTSDDLVCQLSFYCLAQEYSYKKYNLTKTHSEVINAAKIVNPGRVLDLGCGSGRNSLYLHKLGFDVTAYDKSTPNIVKLKQIIEEEGLENFRAQVYDINQATLNQPYDLIISTVVMMFLARVRIPDIIDNMQQNTVVGGYNLIVSAMSTEDCPCNVPFSFTFKENELRDYYQGWEIIKYNEDMGQLHKTDINGDRIKLRFATLLARKQ